MDGNGGTQDSWLLCRAGAHLCALPLAQILEVMRPLPIETLAEAPPFVRGLSVIRGAPVPVLDLGQLLGQAKTATARVVTIGVAGRILGLAVAEVLGVRRADEVGLQSAVPLLREAAQEVVSAIGALDSEALLFLEGMRVLAQGVPG